MNLKSFLLQLNHAEMVEGLVLINVNPCAEGWMDWAATKVNILSQENKSYCEPVKHEELGKLVCQDMAADTKYPRLIPLGFNLPFANIPPAGLVIKISTLRKQIPVV